MKTQSCSKSHRHKRREDLYKRIKNHGLDLLAIFPAAREKDPVKLCKALQRLERKCNLAAISYCNGDSDTGSWERMAFATSESLMGLLGIKATDLEHGVFVNPDPRGYALKIKDNVMSEKKLKLHRDWGGYGILAPDLT